MSYICDGCGKTGKLKATKEGKYLCINCKMKARAMAKQWGVKK